jgi:hypothetical protein
MIVEAPNAFSAETTKAIEGDASAAFQEQTRNSSFVAVRGCARIFLYLFDFLNLFF